LVFDTIVMHAQGSLEARMRGLGGDWADWPVRLVEEGTAAATLAVADDDQIQIVIEHDPARIAPEMAAALSAQVLRLLEAMA
jgi:uncharacterized protein (DUF1786 family)